MTTKKVISLRDAAIRLKRSEWTIRRMIRTSQLEAGPRMVIIGSAKTDTVTEESVVGFENEKASPADVQQTYRIRMPQMMYVKLCKGEQLTKVEYTELSAICNTASCITEQNIINRKKRLAGEGRKGVVGGIDLDDDIDDAFDDDDEEA